jgi:aspartate/tyrosine/aromatic aminotransferase
MQNSVYLNKKAEEIIFKANTDNEYLPVEGLESFIKGSARLAYSENNKALKEKRIAAVQSLSGTGAVRLGMELVKKYLPASNTFKK